MNDEKTIFDYKYSKFYKLKKDILDVWTFAINYENKG